MFFLFTGLPGSQKTANMINFVLTDSQFQDRPVYYHNIKGCKIEDWTLLSDEEAGRWYDLPDGAVILFDEGQRLFRPSRSTVIDRKVTELETHRHQGFDIIMTTQHPRLIHSDVKSFVQHHRHYRKPYGLRTFCHIWEGEGAIDNPTSETNKGKADKQESKLPKSVFDLYDSTKLDTHGKKRIPKILWRLLALLVVVGGLIGWLAYDFSTRTEEGVTLSGVSEAFQPDDRKPRKLTKSGTADGFKPFYPMDPAEYAKVFMPRIPNAPHTAPVYDELVKPQVAPKTRCFGYHRFGVYHCKCVTQQMTPIDMDYEQCVSIVQEGLWDAAPVTEANYTARGQLM